MFLATSYEGLNPTVAFGDGASSGQASRQLEGMAFSGPLPCARLHGPFILPFAPGTTPNLGKGRSSSAFQEEWVLQAWDWRSESSKRAGRGG